MTEPALQDRLRLSCNRKHCNCTRAQAAREIDRLQADLKTLSDEYQATCAASNAMLDRMEKAEAELKALAEQQPLLHIQFSDCGAHIRFWTRSKQRMQEQQAAAPKSPMVTLYARPIPATPSALHRDAARVLAAWDGTCAAEVARRQAAGGNGAFTGCARRPIDRRNEMNKQDLKPYKLAQKLRSSANRCTRINADVAILCEHALAAAAWLEDEATDITNMVGSVTHDALMGRMTPGYVISDMPTMSYPAIPTEWIATITFARDIFQNYANLHRAKGTQDGDEKARLNQRNADALTKLLERAK